LARFGIFDKALAKLVGAAEIVNGTDGAPPVLNGGLGWIPPSLLGHHFGRRHRHLHLSDQQGQHT
jgi:hypothetical protein